MTHITSTQLASPTVSQQAGQPGQSSVAHYSLREAWLLAGVELLRPLFASKHHILPDCQVSVGFASTGNRAGHIGQCWSTGSTDAQVNQIFISPALVDPVAVLDTLVHELVHAVDDCQHKHGKEFKKIALSLGLKGPMRSAGAGADLLPKLQALAQQLGPYPHAQLHVPSKRLVIRNRPRAQCKTCGYQVPMLKKFLAFGPPICPQDKVEMEAIGNWDEF